MDEETLYTDNSERAESEVDGGFKGHQGYLPLGQASNSIGTFIKPNKRIGSEASQLSTTNAQDEAKLQLSTGVVRVKDSEAGEDIVSTTALYKKKLGITEYDELRSKLNLRADESFTDYYNRTKYIPEGYEVQAKLLLAEESRKKLYAEVEAGKMSEEDFLYEAYGKDILKQEGIDFSSSLYWYNRYQSGQYDDPRDNPTFLTDLIEQSRTLFQQEAWYEDKSRQGLNMANFVTGQTLSTETIESLFPEQFEALTQYFDSAADIVKYYRAGLLQGFDPTIDTNGDGKIDYYLATDGKLYNVNETGEGANTMRAIYNEDGSLNRIVASDSYLGEVTGELLKGFGRFFTDTIDFFAIIGGAVVDVFDGGGFGDTVADVQASMSKFWNTTVLADKDYVVDSGFKTSDGNVNWGNMGRSVSRFAGTIAGFFTAGYLSALTGPAAAGTQTLKTATTKATQKGVKAAVKNVLNKVVPKAATKTATKAASKVSAKAVTNKVLNTAMKLTSWSNGASASTSVMATVKSAATLAVKDTLQSVATLSINQKQLGLTDDQVLSRALTGGAINFGASTLLRSTLDKGALTRWGQAYATISNTRAESMATQAIIDSAGATTFASRLAQGLLKPGEKIAVGIGNTLMDSLENVITAWTQTSLSTTGKVFDSKALGSLFNNPQFVFNSLFQMKNTMQDEFHYKSNNIATAINDVSKLDSDVRSYFNDLRADADPETLAAVNSLEVEYDRNISERLKSKVGDRNASQAEATLYAIEKLVVGMDIQSTHPLMKKWQEDIKSNIKQKKMLLIQAEFNAAQTIYDNYNKAVKTGFQGRLTDLLYGKEIATFTEGLAKYTQKFFAYDIQDKVLSDAKRKMASYHTLFSKTYQNTEYTDQVEVNTLANLKYKFDKDGNPIFDPGTDMDNWTDEEKAVYIKYLQQWGVEGDDDKGVVFTIKGSGTAQESSDVRQDDIKFFNFIDAIEKEFSDSEYPPLFIKLSDNRYILRFHGIGETQLQVNNIGSFIRGLASLRTSVAAEENISAKEALAILLYHLDPEEINKDINTTITDNLSSLPKILHLLIDNKIVNVVEATKLYTAIKDALPDKTVMPTITDKDTNFKYYKETEDMVEFLTKLSEARENAAKLRQAGPKALTDEYKEAKVKLISFVTKYAPTDSEGNAKETTVLANAQKAYIITKPEINEFAKLSFQVGQVTRDDYLNSFMELAKGFISAKNKEAKFNDDFYSVFIEKFGIKSDADKQTITINNKTFSLKNLNNINQFASAFLFDRKPVQTKQITSNGVTFEIIDGKEFDIFTDSKFNSKFKEFIKDKPITAKTIEEIKDYIDTTVDSNKGYKINGTLYSVENADAIKDKAKVKLDKAFKKYTYEGLAETFKLYCPKDQVNAVMNRFMKSHTDPNINILEAGRDWIAKEYNGILLADKLYITDMFEKGIEHYEAVTKYCSETKLDHNNILTINLDALVGSEGEKVYKKLLSEEVKHILSNKDEGRKIESILFANNDAKAKFTQQQNFINRLRDIHREDNMLFFNLNDASEYYTAKQLLDRVYNYNGDLKHIDHKKIMPGVYSNSDSFVGMLLGDSTILNKLDIARKRNSLNRLNSIKDYTILDPAVALERFVSSVPYLTEDTVLDPTEIAWNFLDLTEELLTDIGDTTIINEQNMKSGKLGAKKLAGVFLKYRGLVASGEIDETRKAQMFVYNLIDSLSSMYSSKPSEEFATYRIPYTDTVKAAYSNINLEVLNELYDVRRVHSDVTNAHSKIKALDISLKRGLTPEAFKEKAFKILTGTYEHKGKLIEPSIEYLLPRFGDYSSESNPEGLTSTPKNRLARPGLHVTQFTNGETPLTYSDTMLSRMFSQDYIDTMFNNNLNLDNIEFKNSYINISENTFNEALNVCKGKTAKEILTLDSTNNPFLQMQQAAIRSGLLLNEVLRKSLDEISTLASESDASDIALTVNDLNTLLPVLMNRDFRANLATAMNTTLKEFEFDSNNDLIVTDKLLDSIIASFRDIKTNTPKDSGTYDPRATITDNKAHLTGSQVEALNPNYTGDTNSVINNRALLSKLLTLLDINKIDIVNKELLEPSPLDKFFGMLKSDSNSTNTQLSVKNLYDLTKEEFEEIKPIVSSVLSKDIIKHIEETLEAIHGDTKGITDDMIFKTLIGDIINPSYNTEGGYLISANEDIKETYRYKKLVETYSKKQKGIGFIKLASINTDQYKHNRLMKGIYEYIMNKDILRFANSKASLMIQDLTLKESLGPFKNSIINLADMLSQVDPNSDGVDFKTYIDVALDCYFYTSGTEYQRYFPEFLIYDKSQHKVVNYALSGNLNDKYVNLIGELISNKDYIDKDGKLNTDNLLVIRTNRNAFNPLYGESLPSISVLDMAKEQNKKLIYDTIKTKALSIADENNLTIADESVLKKTTQYYFDALAKTERQYFETLEKKSKGLVIDGVISDLINDPSDYSFTNKHRTLSEELLYNETHITDSFWDLKGHQNTHVSKVNDALNYGITYDVLMKNKDLKETLKVSGEKARTKIVLDLMGLTEDITELKKTRRDPNYKETKRLIHSNMHSIIDSIRKGDKDKALLHFNNLYDYLNTEDSKTLVINKTITKDYLLEKVLSYYVSTNSDIGTALHNLIGSNNPNDIGRTHLRLFDKNTRQLKRTPTISIDLENMFNRSNGKEFVYEIGIHYVNPSTGEDTTKTVHLMYGTIKDEKVLRDTFPDYFKEYVDVAGGSSKSLEEYNKNLASGNVGITQDIIDLLKRADSENAILLGFNSEKFDLPKLLNAPELKDLNFNSYTNLTNSHADMQQLFLKYPTIYNILTHKGELTLKGIADQVGSALVRQYSSQGHLGSYDARLTTDVWNLFLNGVIDTDAHKFKLYNDLQEVAEGLGVTDNPFELESIVDTVLKDTRYKMISEEDIKALSSDSAELLKALSDIKDSDGPTRYKEFFEKITSDMSYKRDINYSDILHRDINKKFLATRNESEQSFAKHFSNKANRDFIINAISYAFVNNTKIPIAQGKLLEALGNDEWASNIFGDIINKITDQGKQSLRGQEDALTNYQEDILRRLGIADRETLNTWARDNSADIINIKNFVDNYYKNENGYDMLADEVTKDTAYNRINFALEDIVDYLEELKPYTGSLDEWLNQEVYTLFDKNAEYLKIDSQGHSYYDEPDYDDALDMMSDIDKAVINYLATDPFTSMTYEGFYRKAQTVPLNRKVVDINGIEQFLNNDTIAVTPDDLYQLMGMDSTSVTKTSVETIVKTINPDSPTGEDLYLPVIRHPLDKLDSIHFIKIIVLDPKHEANKGLHVALTTDTMRTRFNGDFDGDGVILMRPDKFTQVLANRTYNLKHKPLQLLDQVLSGIVQSGNFELGHSRDILDRLQLEYDPEILQLIKTDMRDLLSVTNGENINKLYDTRRKAFKEFLIQYRDLSEKDAEDITDIIYIHAPIDTSKNVISNNRFAIYTDCMGILVDPEMSATNYEGRRAFTLSNIMVSDLLSKVDTITGMRQKRTMLDASKYEDLQLADNIIRISKSTKKFLKNNIDSAKDILKGLVENLTDLDASSKNLLLDYIKNSKQEFNENNFEEVLRYIQFKLQPKYSSEVKRLIPELKTSDSPLVKMFNNFMSEDSILVEDEHGRKVDPVFKTYTDLLKAKQSIEGRFFQHNSDKTYTDIIRMLSQNNSYNNAVDIRELAKPTSDHYSLYKDLEVVYELDHSDAYTEDTVRLLEGSKAIKAVDPKIVDNLSESLMKTLKSRIANNNLILDNDKDIDLIKKLGIEPNPFVTVKLIEAIDDNAITVARYVDFENVKLGHLGVGYDKATTTVYGTQPSGDAFKNCSLLKTLSSVDEKKVMTTLAMSKDVKYFDTEGTEVIPDKDFKNVAYIKATEPYNALEVSRLWDPRVKSIQIEELGHGNNLDSASGVWLTKGLLYQISKDIKGKTTRLTLDNSEYARKLHDLSNTYAARRFDHNGTLAYQIIKLATAAKYLKEIPYGYDTPKDYVDNIVKGCRGHTEILEAEANKIIMLLDLEKIPKKDRVILGNELYNYVYGIGRRTTGEDMKLSSKNAAHSTLASKSPTHSNASYRDSTTDIDNPHQSFENNFIAMADLEDKILELWGSSSRLYRSTAEEAEKAGALNHGLARKRTQTSGGPIPWHVQDTANTPDINTTGTKIAESLSTTVSSTNYGGYSPMYSNLKLGTSFDPNELYKDSNVLLREARDSAALHLKRNSSKKLPKNMDSIKIKRFMLLMKALGKNNTNYTNLLYDINTEGRSTSISFGNGRYHSNKDGTISYRADRKEGGYSTVNTMQAYKDIQDLGKSAKYWEKAEAFEKDNKDTVTSFINQASNDSLKVQGEQQADKAIQDFAMSKPLSETSEEYRKWEETMSKRKVLFTENPEHMIEPKTLEEIKARADRKFYSGHSSGVHKQFDTTKFGLNNGFKFHDNLDLEADRIVKQLLTEGSARAQEYSTPLLKLQSTLIRNGTEDLLNEFAYILGLKNELDVIAYEKSQIKSDKAKLTAYEEIENNIKEILNERGVTDPDTFIKDFENVHAEEVVLLYDLLKRLNFEAEKYSKLTGEPGSNIFFMLIPNTGNTFKETNVGAKYMISMLAKGSSPIQKHVDNKHVSYTASNIPAYASYNALSSLCDTINNITRQSTVYEVSSRLKHLGLMDSVSTQNIVYDIFNKPEVQESLTARTKYSELQIEALDMFFEIVGDEITLYEPTLKTAFNEIYKHAKDQGSLVNVGETYITVFNLLNRALSTKKLSLEQAVDIQSSYTDTSDPTYIEAEAVIRLNQIYSDVFAQLSSLTNDDIINKTYDALIKGQGDNLAIVDKYGRIQSEDFMYKHSDNSLEYIADNIEKYTNYKHYIVNAALRGEIFFMDKALAETLGDQVFIKQDAKGFKKKLQQTSQWCTKMLMSNPFKLIDRVFKFTAFDLGALGSSNVRTFAKMGQAKSEMSAFFASKGAVASPLLKEFAYSQGLKLDADNFGLIMNNTEATTKGFLSGYTNKVGDVFNLQTMTTRYAYWLATKEDIENNRYQSLGSAYHLKDKLQELKDLKVKENVFNELTGEYESQEVTKVSAAGNQAAFAMAQILGAPGDFPSASRKLNKYGFVFTTFPLAAVRWGIGELRSIASSLSNIFVKGTNRKESMYWLAQNGLGIAGVFMLEQMLISTICDMFDVDEEKEEEWEESGALPNITQTILQGQPIMDTFSSMNPVRELADLTVNPFIPKDENDSVLSGFERFFNKNILSHTNPIAKNVYEIATEQDLIDDQIISTKDKYGMFDNLFRKLSGYVIGASGANAMTKELFNKDASDSSLDKFYSGLKAAVSAEVGNTKAYKSNVRNYYKALSIVNDYIYKDSTDKHFVNADFNSGNYDAIKSSLYSMVSSEAKISDIYSLIDSYISKGYSPNEIRSAFRTCSLVNRLERIEDQDEFYEYLSGSELQAIKTALAFEDYMYPWLDDSEEYLTDEISKSSNSYKSNYLNLYNYKPKTIYNNYNNNYSQYNMRSNSNYDYNKYNKDSFDSYWNTLYKTWYSDKKEDK